jgi:2-polyprenyl-3-methyl-5-hydroxy-6-metoxy-1,4-benzoquinol methylase
MQYVRPPIELLRKVATERSSDIALDVYCASNFLFREFFWLRLWMLSLLIRRQSGGPCDVCLDFGGGSGVFAPTLVTGFRHVRSIDQNTREAEAVKSALALDTLSLVSTDIAAFEFAPRSFDAVVAADVLEHFRDLELPVSRIRRWLKPGGYLYTSLPTENLAYRLLRLVFGKKKPEDHYHDAATVEAFLRRSGFRKVRGLYHPLFVPVFPLFRISAWENCNDD